MNRQRRGLVLFWLGVVYMFVASWLAMWWVASIFANTPPEEFVGTIWAYGGPSAIALSVPVGIVLMTLGTMLYGESEKARVWPYVLGRLFTFLSHYKAAQATG